MDVKFRAKALLQSVAQFANEERRHSTRLASLCRLAASRIGQSDYAGLIDSIGDIKDYCERHGFVPSERFGVYGMKTAFEYSDALMLAPLEDGAQMQLRVRHSGQTSPAALLKVWPDGRPEEFGEYPTIKDAAAALAAML